MTDKKLKKVCQKEKIDDIIVTEVYKNGKLVMEKKYSYNYWEKNIFDKPKQLKLDL